MEVAPCVAGSAPRASARATAGERACDEVGKGVRWRRGEDGVSRARKWAGWGWPTSGSGRSRRALLGCITWGRKDEEGEGRKERREKKKEKRKKREKEKNEKERELSARFAAAVGHARAATFGRSTTCTRNERRRKQGGDAD